MIEVYEPAWSMGDRSRWIFWGFLTNIAYGLINIYASKDERSKLRNMMQQMVDSTFMLHSKSKVNPAVLTRWNETVEQIYRKLHEVAIDTYHEFEETLKSHIDNAENDGERFFYYGQLMLLAILDNQRENVKIFAKKLAELEQHAGNYADRISIYMKYTIEVMNVSSDQDYLNVGKSLSQINRFDDFRDTLRVLSSIIDHDVIVKSINFNQLAQFALNYLIKANGREITHSWLEIRRLYENCGFGEQIMALAEKIQREANHELEEEGTSQLFLEYAEFDDLEFIEFSNKFTQEEIDVGWEWIDPKGKNKYKIEKNKYLQIDVTRRYDLWGGYNYDAPRLLRQISSDFVIETKILGGDNGIKYGGLLIWKDKNNFIRLELPAFYWADTIYYAANLNGKFIHPGVHPLVTKEAWLRIERKCDRFTGYVSTDKKNWYRCGWLDMPAEDPIKIGIYAINPTLSTISTRFEYFKIYRINK